MASFSDDMRPLAQNLIQDHEIRVEAVDDLRFNVKLELNNNRTSQQAMSAEQEKALDKYMDDLHSQVNKLRQAAATFLGDLDKSNQSMADQLSLQLTGQRSRLATDTAVFIDTISSAHQEMATAQKQNLVKGRNQLRAEVIATLEKNHTEQSAVRTDQAEAANIWASISQPKLSQPKQKKRTKKGSTKSSQAAKSA